MSRPPRRLAHRLIALEGEGQMDVMLELSAPGAPRTGDRPPSSLALVIDRSGSMAGPKLRAVQQAAGWLARRLDARDRACLVGFDDQAALELALAADAPRGLAHALARLRPGGMTNLSGGLLLGLEQLDRAPADEPRVILLLTDGLANVGIVDEVILTGLCREASRRGIRVSTVGIGDGFNEDLLRAMADAGGGTAHWAPGPDAAQAVFTEELTGLTELVAQAVSLEMRPGDGVEVDVLNDYPATPVDGGMRIDVGDLYADEVRRLVLRMTGPDLPAARARTVAGITLRYTLLGDGIQHVAVRVPVVAGALSAAEAARLAQASGMPEEVQVLLAARVRDEAVGMSRSGDHRGASAHLRQFAVQMQAGWGPGVSARVRDEARDLHLEAGLFDLADPLAEKTSGYSSQRRKRGKGGRAPSTGEGPGADMGPGVDMP